MTGQSWTRRSDAHFALFLLAATLVTYAPAWHGPPIFDDATHLTAPALRSLDGLRRIWLEPGVVPQYYPLFHSVLWIEHRLWGESMLGYHLVNLVLHAGVAFLAMRLLRKLGVPGAHLAAAIFALHPVHVESVAYVSEMKNTLSGFFCLGAALAYLRYDETRQRSDYVAALALFVAGWMSKGVIATLPAALLVILWWKKGRVSLRRDIVPILPLLGLGILGGLVTSYVERRFIGATGAEFAFSPIERILIAGRAFWFYLGKLFWPTDLTLIYTRWSIDAGAAWQYVYPAGLFLLLAGLWSIRRRVRGPLAAVLLFAGTLLPVLGFLNVYPFRYSFVADHYQYLASLSIIALAGAGISLVAGRRTAAKTVAASAFLCCLAALSWRQSRFYSNAETMYRMAIARNAQCWAACNNLATLLQGEGRAAEATELLGRAVQLKPDYVEAHDNLGVALIRQQRFPEAIESLHRALDLKPDFADAHCNLGVALSHQNRAIEAIEHFRRALALDPGLIEARVDLADQLARVDRLDDAIVEYEQLLRLAPGVAAYHNDLGAALARAGRTREAVEQFREVLRLDPNSQKGRSNLRRAEEELAQRP